MGCGIGDDGRCVSGWSIFRLSNTILGCFNCYEGLFRQISDSPLLHASNFQNVMHEYRHPKSNRGRRRGDYYQEKAWITFITFNLLIAGRTRQPDEPFFMIFFQKGPPGFQIRCGGLNPKRLKLG